MRPQVSFQWTLLLSLGSRLPLRSLALLAIKFFGVEAPIFKR